MTASPLSTRFTTARCSNLATVALAGVLGWFACAPQSVHAQDVAAGEQKEAEEADESADMVLGDDLQAIVPELTDELVTYLGKRNTRRVAIEGLRGAEPLVEKVMVRTLTAGLKAEGIANNATAATRLKGRLTERQDGGRRLAVLEWCLLDRTGFELCAMRHRLTITGPLVVEAPEEVIASRE
ncbi:hypothetical protein Mal4_45440 [Maioricimonas rarisocia]|uniref:Uncharacterized protein n=1 Tax=Maioricimonas rarisocia TaxID=2528026 RepID=A0A517ZCK1_9PLAN|nr:hypothetical protein [Maioricimonas rarisocia]QDU40189.1 hypothetical protein Mal4_45440 [Maioricimonas rarisocia]